MAVLTTADRLLTPQEVADLLNVRVQTLALWRSAKRYPELKYTKVGAFVRYKRSDVQAWLDSRTVGAAEKD